jgi:hypothetical protein
MWRRYRSDPGADTGAKKIGGPPPQPSLPSGTHATRDLMLDCPVADVLIASIVFRDDR